MYMYLKSCVHVPSAICGRDCQQMFHHGRPDVPHDVWPGNTPEIGHTAHPCGETSLPEYFFVLVVSVVCNRWCCSSKSLCIIVKL